MPRELYSVKGMYYPPLDFEGRGTMRSMVEGPPDSENPLHRTSCGPPPLRNAGEDILAPLRQLPFPRQRIGDDRVEIVELRPPGEGREDLAIVGDQSVGVARAPCLHPPLDLDVGDPVDGVEHFEHREAAAVAAIHDVAALRLGDQFLERVDMGGGE